MRELTVGATVDSIGPVTEFVNEYLDAISCPMKARIQLDIAIDEVMSNIARYAYQSEGGTVTLSVAVEQAPLSVVLTFLDAGTPFDPLESREPDVTLSTEERELGGLGIYLVKKTMDEVSYTRRDGKNILRIRRALARP